MNLLFVGLEVSTVSIQLVSPASGDHANNRTVKLAGSFHSMSFPSEWGLYEQHQEGLFNFVSIQLVSPASGDDGHNWLAKRDLAGFHSISFPSEWGHDVVSRS